MRIREPAPLAGEPSDGAIRIRQARGQCRAPSDVRREGRGNVRPVAASGSDSATVSLTPTRSAAFLCFRR